MWETTEIVIGGKNPTDVNFAIIRNQVRFIDTVKYFQQSLGSLAESMTDTERENVRKICRKFLAEKLMFLNDDYEKWVLDYLASGKGMIPYQMIIDFDALNIQPEKDFFKYDSFYSSLKEKNISQEEYENVKKFFTILRMKTLGDLNRVYNFQDTAILCEILESRFALLQILFEYNAKKCNSASSFSGCVHRLKSKCKIVLPTDAEIVRIFEKTVKSKCKNVLPTNAEIVRIFKKIVMAGYSCINTRMAFDIYVLLKDTKNEKLLFKTADGQLKRFSSKIIKMDEKNQYGMVMTRPLPYGCIKRKLSVLVLKSSNSC